MAAIASGVARAREVQQEAKTHTKKKSHTFGDISTRAAVFRDRLIDEFRLLDLAEATQSSHAPVYDAGSLFPPPPQRAGGGEGGQEEPQPPPVGMAPKVLSETPHQMVGFKLFKRRAGEEKKFEDKRMTRLKNVNSPPLGLVAHWIVTSPVFEWIILAVIVVNAVVLGVQAELSEDEHEHWFTLRICYYLDIIALYIFLFEIALKWSDSFVAFWRSGWNIFDFWVTLLSAIPEVMPLFLSGGSSTSSRIAVVAKQLRLLRVLRALKLLVHFTGIRIIVETTLQAFNSMTFIMVLLGLVAYIYAVAGVYVFSEYTESSRTDLEFQEKFRGMDNALLTLFQLITLDQWYALHQDISKVVSVGITATYFLSWIFVGAFAFKNIFIGVSVKYFAVASERMHEEKAARKKKSALKRYFKKLKTYNSTIARGATTRPAPLATSAAADLDRSDSDSSIAPAAPKSIASAQDSLVLQRISSFLVQNREEGFAWDSQVTANLAGLSEGNLETLWPRDTLFNYLRDASAMMECQREIQELNLLASWTLFDAIDT